MENLYWKCSVLAYQHKLVTKPFPEAKYADVVGLCKLADKAEYVEEQDYSLVLIDELG